MNERDFKLQSLEPLAVGEWVKVVSKVSPYQGEGGAIVLKRHFPTGLRYGVVFDWDVAGIPVYFASAELERGV